MLEVDAVAESWLRAAEERYLADLTFSELTRALRAVSSCYVERRPRLASGAALGTAGKRAAFALYYGPLHYVTMTALAGALGGPAQDRRLVVDLGCGTGASGAAWARAGGDAVAGYDLNAWAVAEARWTYGALGVRGTATRAAVERVRWPARPALILAAYVLNELPAPAREHTLTRLLEAADHGHQILVVEPIARRAAPWWPSWEKAIGERGGRADEWRFALARPDVIARLDRATGLDHRELTARTLSLGLA